MNKNIILISFLIFLFASVDLIADDNIDAKISIDQTNITINFPNNITFNIKGSSTEKIQY